MITAKTSSVQVELERKLEDQDLDLKDLKRQIERNKIEDMQRFEGQEDNASRIDNLDQKLRKLQDELNEVIEE